MLEYLDINYDNELGCYVTDPIQVTNDCGLHITFADEGATIYIDQSIHNGEFVNCHTETRVGLYYDVIVEGTLPGMYIRVRTSKLPEDISILM